MKIIKAWLRAQLLEDHKPPAKINHSPHIIEEFEPDHWALVGMRVVIILSFVVGVGYILLSAEPDIKTVVIIGLTVVALFLHLKDRYINK